KALAQRAGRNFGVDRILPSAHLPYGLDQLRLTNRFDQCAADLWRHIQAKDFCKSLIGKKQAVRAIDYCYSFDHASENGGREVALIFERTNGKVELRGAFIERRG